MTGNASADCDENINTILIQIFLKWGRPGSSVGRVDAPSKEAVSLLQLSQARFHSVALCTVSFPHFLSNFSVVLSNNGTKSPTNICICINPLLHEFMLGEKIFNPIFLVARGFLIMYQLKQLIFSIQIKAKIVFKQSVLLLYIFTHIHLFFSTKSFKVKHVKKGMFIPPSAGTVSHTDFVPERKTATPDKRSEPLSPFFHWSQIRCVTCHVKIY